MLVDNQPIGSPYVDPRHRPAARHARRVRRSPALQRLRLLEASYGVGVDVTEADDLAVAGRHRCATSTSPSRLAPDDRIQMIGIVALVVGIVLGLVFHPSVPDVDPAVPADRGRRRARRGVRRAARLPRAHLRLEGVRHLVRVQRAGRGAHRLRRRPARASAPNCRPRSSWCSASASSATPRRCGADCSGRDA